MKTNNWLGLLSGGMGLGPEGASKEAIRRVMATGDPDWGLYSDDTWEEVDLECRSISQFLAPALTARDGYFLAFGEVYNA